MSDAPALHDPGVIRDIRSAETKGAHHSWLWLVVLPVCFVMLHSIFLQARGPFYLGHNLDPDYAYLCNSLNVARSKAPYHVDHPGTTLQLFGAIVLKFAHPLASGRELITSVLREPERHLQWINAALAGSYFASLLLAGILLWKRTGRLLPSLVLQATPFVLGHHFRMVTRVAAEPMLLIVGTLLATVLYLYASSYHARAATLPIISGALVALGIVTKLSFAPLALTPLLCFRTWKDRFTYLLAAAVMGGLWLIPLDYNDKLLRWVAGLITHQGRYGTGATGLLPPEYASHVLRLFIENPFLTVSVALSWLAAAYGVIWQRRRETNAQRTRWSWLLLGLAAGQTLQMLVVAKYGPFGKWRYLLPTVMMYPLTVLALLEFANNLWPRNARSAQISALAVCIALVLPTLTLPAHYSQTAQASAERLKSAEALDKITKGHTTVFYLGASSPDFALWFGNEWAGNRYAQVLHNDVLTNRVPTFVLQFSSGDLVLAGRSYGHISTLNEPFFLAGVEGLERNILSFLPADFKRQKLSPPGREILYKIEPPQNPRQNE